MIALIYVFNRFNINFFLYNIHIIIIKKNFIIYVLNLIIKFSYKRFKKNIITKIFNIIFFKNTIFINLNFFFSMILNICNNINI